MADLNVFDAEEGSEIIIELPDAESNGDDGKIVAMEKDTLVLVDRKSNRYDVDGFTEEDVIAQTNTEKGMKCIIPLVSEVIQDIAGVIVGNKDASSTTIPYLTFYSKEVSDQTIILRLTDEFGSTSEDLAKEIMSCSAYKLGELCAVTCKNALWSENEEVIAFIAPSMVVTAAEESLEKNITVQIPSLNEWVESLSKYNVEE